MLRKLLELIGVYRIYEYWLTKQVDKRKMPQHIGVILDGNRRWAKKKRLPPWVGHRYGASKTEEFLKWCLDLGIKTITLYAFSTENFARSKREVEEILSIAEREIEKAIESPEIHKNKVKVKLLGRKDLLPLSLRKRIEKLENVTRDYNRYYLNLALAYGGRAEIIDAVKSIAKDVKAGLLEPEEINEQEFERRLYTSHLPNPHPDLIIRTSGEIRLSGFLLWQSAYSELYFIDVYWPDFRKIDLLRAIRDYQKRERRFGR